MAGTEAVDTQDTHVLEEAITGLREEIERGYEAFIGDPSRLHEGCPPYVSLTSGGIKDEGARHPARYPSPKEARDAFVRAFRVYAAGRGNTLIWRELPSMTEADGYSVYSRLIVVDTVGANA